MQYIYIYIIIIDWSYIALTSALQLTPCSHVACDSEWVTLSFCSTFFYYSTIGFLHIGIAGNTLTQDTHPPAETSKTLSRIIIKWEEKVRETERERKKEKRRKKRLTDTLAAGAVEGQTTRAGTAERTLGVDALTAPTTDPREQLTLVDVCQNRPTHKWNDRLVFNAKSTT